MLVLARKENQVLVIGDGANQVRIYVVETRHDRVRLGIEAPRDVPVHRLEVYEQMVRKQSYARSLHTQARRQTE